MITTIEPVLFNTVINQSNPPLQLALVGVPLTVTPIVGSVIVTGPVATQVSP